MGGKKRCPAYPSVTGAVQVPDGGQPRDSYPGASGAVMEVSGRGGLLMETIIAGLVAGVIGWPVVLHDLLGSADFAPLYSGRGECCPMLRCRYIHGVPFQVAFHSHGLDYANRLLTIVSKGDLKIIHRRKVPILMELSLERIAVSPLGAAMQWAGGDEPLVLDFNRGPEVFSETAFSFNIGKEGRAGLAGCGFVAFADG